jgi:peptidoglycan/LPS O-acetylase OafA/YrhL
MGPSDVQQPVGGAQTTTSPTQSNRRHDLDALRAFAMLLGIALHGAMAYFPAPWPVQDSQQHPAFGIFVAAVHGFRMQLFFVLAGFFTAMVWRRKGLPTLLRNRASRVLLPCLIGLVTVVPFFHWITAKVTAPSVAIVREYHAGDDVNAPDSQFRVTPLSWSALQGDLPMAQRLVTNGANVNGKNGDGSTPLHGAAFVGREDLVRFLLANGADPNLRNNNGQLPSDSARADAGTTQFLIGYLRLSPRLQSDIQAGRERLLPLLPASSTPAIPDAKPTGGIRESYLRFLTTGPLAAIFMTNVFDHLWFLWNLCFLMGAFAVWATIETRRSTPIAMRFQTWILSPRRYLWLIPVTLIPQALMGMNGYVFGPDTATGLLPPPHLLAYYGMFFFFGVLYFDADDAASELGRHWSLTLPIALLVVLPIGLISQPLLRPLSDFLQVCYAWLMVTGGIGLFRRVLSQEHARIRYVSDASYWMYLIHLPLLVVLQALAMPVPMPAPLKFLLLMGLSLTLLLLSYQLMVRNTPIGILLNGSRKVNV